MPRGVKKENLPTKVCVTCGRPFTWRKKWERVWDEVTTCSKSCNRKRRAKNRGVASADESDSDAEMLAAGVNDINIVAVGEDASSDTTIPASGDATILASLDTSHSPSDDDNSAAPDEDGLSDAPPPPELLPPILDAKAQRKAEKKRKKAERRAQREGRGDPTAGQKQCTLCSKSVDLLIRCTHDASGEWSMVCGKCWNDVSGGVVDGDAAHPHYRYGGLWKNRRAQT